jgi:hypothetical protein
MAEEHYILTSEADNGNAGFSPNIEAASDSGHCSNNSDDDCYPLSGHPPPDYTLLHRDQQRRHSVLHRTRVDILEVNRKRRWCRQDDVGVCSASPRCPLHVSSPREVAPYVQILCLATHRGVTFELMDRSRCNLYGSTKTSSRMLQEAAMTTTWISQVWMMNMLT